MHQTVLEHTDQKDGENSVYFRYDKLIGCLHLTWEKALMETGQTYDCLILDGRREHEASLANMALTL